MKNCQKPNVIFATLTLLLWLPFFSFSQTISFSDPVKEYGKNHDYEVIGKLKGNVLIFENSRTNYNMSIYDDAMALKENFKLSFLPDGTFNVDFIPFADSLYIIYQCRKKGIVYCMAATLDANAKLMNDPVQLDDTKVSWLGDDKVYTTIYSEDKKKIMLLKVLQKNDSYSFETLLYDSNLKLLRQGQSALPFDSRKDLLSDFFVDNDGNFVFVKAFRPGARDDINKINLVIKSASKDTFELKDINLNNNYLDEIKLKVDNGNKHYIINSFYYNERSGNIDGIFCNTWDRQGDSNLVNNFIPLDDTLKTIAKASGSTKTAFNNFFIRSIIVKKDGGYLLAAEDYYQQANNIANNPWNRMNYLYGNPYGMSPFYNPGLNNNQFIQYYYNNVLVMSIDKNGKSEWSDVLHKSQYSDVDNSHLSYLAINGGGQIHFLFNEIGSRIMLLQDNSITPDGTLTRNPPFKTMDKDYEFMPKFGKQVGARQVIIPCTYKSSICFAKIDF